MAAGDTGSTAGSHRQLPPLVEKVRHSWAVIRVMAPEDGDGAGGLPAGAPRIAARATIVRGRGCSAVGAGVDVSRDDHDRLTRNVAVTRTTTAPIAAHTSERETPR